MIKISTPLNPRVKDPEAKLAESFSDWTKMNSETLELGLGKLCLVTAVMEAKSAAPESLVHEVLHREELELYHKIKDARRKFQFLTGRYVAKKNLARYQRSFRMSDLAIVPDIHGKPAIVSEMPVDLSLSISHVDNLAVSLTGATFRVGVDIEIVRKSLLLIGPVILGKSERETMSKFSFAEPGAIEALTWSAKESVSKYLGSGITGALERFAIASCLQIEANVFRMTFQHFPGVQAQAYLNAGLVLSFACEQIPQLDSKRILNRLETLKHKAQEFCQRDADAA
jgi:phosphopantetheinyl transferase